MVILNNIREDLVPTFMMAQLDRSRNPRSQGFAEALRSRARACQKGRRRNQASLPHVGDSDLVIFVDAPSGDNVAKFALAVSSLGNVRTRTVRAWSADEYRKLISELP
jgi:uncharacterized protein with GYD domain